MMDARQRNEYETIEGMAAAAGYVRCKRCHAFVDPEDHEQKGCPC